MKKLYLWSKRWSTARGEHWIIERLCEPATAEQWLEVFQKDEPTVEFKLSYKRPKIEE